MSNVQPARGFRDFDPAIKRRKEDLLSQIRAVYRQYGFEEIETPVVEPIERLRNSEGGENVGMIFQIMRRGLNQEDLSNSKSISELCDLGLRYDLTVPLARFFASNYDQLPNVFRAIQIGPVWRAERPQKGRYRQFTQCDIDIIGESSPLAEIELIIATLAALDAIGLKDSVVHLNDRRLLDAVLAHAGVAVDIRPRVLIVIDKLDKIGFEGVCTSLAEFLPPDIYERLVSTLRRFESQDPLTIEDLLMEVSISEIEAVADHRLIMSAVQSVCGPSSIRFDPMLVRGLGYYTGSIFEIAHPLSKGSIAGGGRYDSMIGKFLGRTVPACGFSLGFDRLLEITERELVGTRPKIALVYEGAGDDPILIVERQRELLSSGYTVRLVRSMPNKKRMFGQLVADGYQQFQRISDPISLLRSVSRED